MLYLTIAKSFLQVLNSISTYFVNKRLIDAGKTEAIADAYQKALENVNKAKEIRDRQYRRDDTIKRLRKYLKKRGVE
jgi:hypothetical protein